MSQSRLKIRVQDDGLCAWVDVVAGPPLAQADLEAQIEAAGIVAGVDSVLCVTIGRSLADPQFAGNDLPVATGDAGEDGVDGFYTLDFSGLKQIGEVRLDGSVNFKERFKIYSAEPGQVLVHYTPATAGIPGETVRGKAVPRRKGTEAKLRCGIGTEFDVDASVICATRAGMISYVAGESISVLDLFAHDGDVDYGSGNLRMEGSVAIAGELHPEFEVEAGGDVIVQGGNCSGSIRAEANVAIAGGVSSSSGSSVQAKGCVTCHHANNVEIVSGQTVLVEDHAVDARLYGAEVRIDTGRGKMIGGEAFAHKSIRVAEAGSPGGTLTRLHVANLDRERAERKARKVKVEGERDPGWIELELLATARIVVTKCIHPGVVVHFAEHRLEVNDYAEDVAFRWDAELQKIVMDSQAVPVPP